MAASKFGSLWHRWDLHIHTDASDGKGTCQENLTFMYKRKCFQKRHRNVFWENRNQKIGKLDIFALSR